MEHVDDPDIKSLALNIEIRWPKTQAIDSQKKIVTKTLERISKRLSRLLPTSIMEDAVRLGAIDAFDDIGLYANILDYSKMPHIDTEQLAELVLKEVLDVLVRCTKCSYIVVADDDVCPECGGALLFVEPTDKKGA